MFQLLATLDLSQFGQLDRTPTASHILGDPGGSLILQTDHHVWRYRAVLVANGHDSDDPLVLHSILSDRRL
jgi:hypothetical protein